MKKILLLLLILSSLNIISGQKSLKNFKGELIFKDCRNYVPINRYLYDTIINYSSIQVGDSFKIEYWALISPETELNQKLIPFIFSKKSDSIFLNYYDPVNKLNVSEYSFSLIKHDTIDYSVCYLMFVDSFSADGKIYKKLLNEFDDENRGLKTVYYNDTVLNFGEYKMACYMFKQFKITGHYQDVNFVRIILFDKTLLVPIDIKEYLYIKKSRRINSPIPKEKWLLYRHSKLIYIND